MRALFLVTGATVWITLACVIILFALYHLYFMIGATIMLWRIVRAVKRAQIPVGPFRINVVIWWRLANGRYNYGSWTIKNTEEKVKWPRPWYNPEDDKEWLPA